MYKVRGLDGMQSRKAELNLSTEDLRPPRNAYERLLLDAVRGNQTLFVRREKSKWPGSGSIKSCRAGKATLRDPNPTTPALTAQPPRLLLLKNTDTAGMSEHHRHNFENRDALMQRAADHIAQSLQSAIERAAWPCWLCQAQPPKPCFPC